MAKKEIYIEAELEWANTRLEEWRDYIDANPFDKIIDRVEWKPTAKGGLIPMVIASKEAQIKCIRDTLKEYLLLLKSVNEMREAEEKKQEFARGGQDIPYRMRKNANKE